jgi:hypothetical protein
MTRRGIAAALAVMLIGVAFAADEPAKVDVRGKATKVIAAPKEAAAANGLLGSVLIEGEKEKTTNVDKALVKVTVGTKIEKLVGGERKPAKFEDLKAGAKAEATFAGPVAQSYPVQATAKSLTILDEEK